MARQVFLSLDSPSRQLSVSRIHENTWNPSGRKAEIVSLLRIDLKRHGPGAFEDILVRPCSCRKIRGRHLQLTDGEKRWTAFRLEGFKSIRGKVKAMDDSTARALSYRRAKEKGEIDAFREAELFKWEMDNGRSSPEIAELYVGLTDWYVRTRLSLLKVPKEYRSKEIEIKDSRGIRHRIVPHGTLSPSMWEVVAQGKNEPIMKAMVVDILRGTVLGEKQAPKTVQQAQNRVNWYNDGVIHPGRDTDPDAEAKATEKYERTKKLQREREEQEQEREQGSEPQAGASDGVVSDSATDDPDQLLLKRSQEILGCLNIVDLVDGKEVEVKNPQAKGIKDRERLQVLLSGLI